MDIQLFIVRRILASIGALGALVNRMCGLVRRLLLIEERRRSEHLRNESSEIQNMQAYEKLLTQHAKRMVSMGRDPRDVDALVSDLMQLRLKAYLALYAMPNGSSEVLSQLRSAESEGGGPVPERCLIDRRLGVRRRILDRRAS